MENEAVPPEELLDFRPPRQSRSRQTLDRIATAALELLEESGESGATVAAIVHRAQASTGSFYARFSGKEDLIRYLRRRVWREATERWDDAVAAEIWEGLPLARIIEGIVSLLVRSTHADHQRRQALASDPVQDPESRHYLLSFHNHVLAHVAGFLLDRRQEITHPEPERAVRVGYWAVVGALRVLSEMEELGPEGSAESSGFTPPEELAIELARLWTAYLRPDQVSEESAAEDGVDFFDPWG